MSELKSMERPQAAEPVMIDLFGDGVERELRFTLGTLQRLKRKQGGKAMMGLRGNLLELDEDMLPALIYEGLRHDPPEGETACACGHHAENGFDPDFPEKKMLGLHASLYSYLLTKFTEAYTGSRPEPKKKPAAAIPDPTTTSKPN